MIEIRLAIINEPSKRLIIPKININEPRNIEINEPFELFSFFSVEIL
jgi:hypothetical protein